MSQRKIIHIDMDCFYAAIEIRDNPALRHLPVAVGGRPEERSVLCTCNYIARKFGVRSAMSSAYALRLCPDLRILPVNMSKYREASAIIHTVLHEYTPLIEPLSLDEAYLDVSGINHCQGSATWIAEEIRQKIFKKTQLTASAGIAPNKFLAKIASGWNKPNGQFVITPNAVSDFVFNLPIEKLFGVGKVTAQKMHQLNIKTCADLQKFSLNDLIQTFGKFGQQLFDQCRGIDNRHVDPDRIRKSISVERTFRNDLILQDDLNTILQELYMTLIKRIKENAPDRPIKNQFLKIKNNQFKVSTIEITCTSPNYSQFKHLLDEFSQREKNPIRLLGLGVHFISDEKQIIQQQLL